MSPNLLGPSFLGIVTECEYYGPGNCSPEAEKCSHKDLIEKK